MGSDGPVINGKAVRVHYDVLKRLFSFVNLLLQEVKLDRQWKFGPLVGELKWMSSPQKTCMVTSLFSAANNTEIMIEENKFWCYWLKWSETWQFKKQTKKNQTFETIVWW